MTGPYLKRRMFSFKYAFEGISSAFREEPNLKLHFLAGFFVILLSFFLNISTTHWILVILIIGLVVSVELTNTAIEAVVDSFTDKQHPGAKLAKDISAGAVLVVSIVASISGALIFLPYLA